MVNFDVDYDMENDDMFLYNKKQKSLFTLEYGDFDIDINKNGEIVGLEFESASKFFYELLKDVTHLNSKNKVKSFLKNTNFCAVNIRKTRRGMIIKLLLKSKMRTPINASIPIPKLTSKKEIQAVYNKN